MNRRSMIVLVGALAAIGCENMGLDYAGPEEEARHRPPSGLVASAHQIQGQSGRAGLIVDGRLWVPSGLPLALQESDFRPVGSADGRTVYARSWDESPYDQIFTVEGGSWRSHLPVIGRGGVTGAERGHAAAGRATGHGTGH